MSATVKQVQVTFDCADPAGLAGFWAEALGYVLDPPPPGFANWDEALDAFGVPPQARNSKAGISAPGGVGPRLFFQQVPESKVVKNRLHLDVRAAPGLSGEARMRALESECERLIGLGATRVHREEPRPPLEAGFIVMTDPQGNEFCLD
ncbi:MAG: VOC family protein [Labedaea sp.]